MPIHFVDQTDLTRLLSHPILAQDLEYLALLRDSSFLSLHLAREQRRVTGILEQGGWGCLSNKGLALIRPLLWDTNHFGFPCGDLVRFYQDPSLDENEASELLENIIEENRRRGIVLLSARIAAHQTLLTRLMLQRGFLLVDTSVELGALLPFSLQRPLLPRSEVQVRLARAEDAAPLQMIAATFTANRFHRDPRILPEKAGEVYTQWVLAAMEKKHGYLLVAEVANTVAGFATYQPADDPLGISVMGLVVVGPAFKGQGIIDALITASAQQLSGQGLVTSTQVSNTAALRAFGRHGLLPINARHIFHYWR